MEYELTETNQWLRLWSLCSHLQYHKQTQEDAYRFQPSLATDTPYVTQRTLVQDLPTSPDLSKKDYIMALW